VNTAAVRYLGPQWFAVVMGWSGLSLAWHRAEALLGGAAAPVAVLAAAVAALAFCLLIAGTLLRWLRYPEAIGADMHHPVRHAFFAAIPISMILLATIAVAQGLDHRFARGLWMLGLALQFAATVWVLGRWPAGVSAWSAKSPVLFIPVVGNVLAPLAGVPLGHIGLSWAFLAIGAFFWPVVVALLFARQSQQPLPEFLLPSWFILIAPPAVVGLSLSALGLGESAMFSMIGIATFSFALALRIAPRLPKLPFGMPFWAMSFPLAAFSALLLKTATAEVSLRLPGIAMLALATLVVLWLSASTLKGLLRGSLLVPDAHPVTAAPPVPSTQKGA
jgi:tellurite resistance protein